QADQVRVLDRLLHEVADRLVGGPPGSLRAVDGGGRGAVALGGVGRDVGFGAGGGGDGGHGTPLQGTGTGGDTGRAPLVSVSRRAGKEQGGRPGERKWSGIPRRRVTILTIGAVPVEPGGPPMKAVVRIGVALGVALAVALPGRAADKDAV